MLEKTLKFLIFVTLVVIAFTLLNLYKTSKDTNEKISIIYDKLDGSDVIEVQRVME